MGSDIINRRTLLTGTALLGLGGLLTACGQQAANEASASASSAAATPSETTSASAAVSETAASTPSPVITRGYSGGSKAPAGEYRPADKYGNAQNVPKPAEPEDGYRERSVEGMRKTLKAWVEWANYGTETGDYSIWLVSLCRRSLKMSCRHMPMLRIFTLAAVGLSVELTILRLMVRRGLRMGRRIFGRRIVTGIVRFMLNLTVVHVAG